MGLRRSVATGCELASDCESRTGQVAGQGLLGERVGGAHGSSRLFSGALGCRFAFHVATDLVEVRAQARDGASSSRLFDDDLGLLGPDHHP